MVSVSFLSATAKFSNIGIQSIGTVWIEKADGVYLDRMARYAISRQRYNFNLVSGVEVPEQEQATVKAALMRDFSCCPVFISDAVADLYYNGFSNRFQQFRML